MSILKDEIERVLLRVQNLPIMIEAFGAIREVPNLSALGHKGCVGLRPMPSHPYVDLNLA